MDICNLVIYLEVFFHLSSPSTPLNVDCTLYWSLRQHLIVQAPDLLKMQRPQDLAPEEILAGVVKYGMRGLLSLGSKI
jgi:hypothetical protein